MNPTPPQVDEDRLESGLSRLASALVADDHVPALSVEVGRSFGPLAIFHGGRQQLDSDQPLRDDALFSIASVTKPIVATLTPLLLDEGLFGLNDRIVDVLPEFRSDAGKHRQITLRQLLTHTSGLPDASPNDREMRQAGASIAEFVEEAARTPLDFKPGENSGYSSLGYAALGVFIERVTGRPLADVLRERLFDPLGMTETVLGLAATPRLNPERIPEIRVKASIRGTASDWNQDYWRRLGAPWGGLFSTASDLGRFARFVLNSGRAGDSWLLSPAAIALATSDQTALMPGIPLAQRQRKPWGLGWRGNWPDHFYRFGEYASERAIGHWGATGTLLWIDPEFDLYAVMLGTEPLDTLGNAFVRLSTVVQACLRPT